MVPNNSNIVSNHNRQSSKKRKYKRKRKYWRSAVLALEKKKLKDAAELPASNGTESQEQNRIQEPPGEIPLQEVDNFNTLNHPPTLMENGVCAAAGTMLQESVKPAAAAAAAAASIDLQGPTENDIYGATFGVDNSEEKENGPVVSYNTDSDTIKKRKRRKNHEDTISSFRKKRRTRHSMPSYDTEAQYVLIHVDKLAQLFDDVKCIECQGQKYRAVPSIPFGCKSVRIECTLCDLILKEVSSDPCLELPKNS